MLMQLQSQKWQETGGSQGVKEQQQLTVSLGCGGIHPFSDMTSGSSSFHCNCTTTSNRNTQRIFTEGSAFPLQVRLWLGHTSLCFNVKNIIAARSTALPLAKWSALSVAHARCCCEKRYLCKWSCNRNYTSLKFLSTQWGFPASNGSFVEKAVITITTTILILTDYRCMSLANTQLSEFSWEDSTG